MKEFDVAIVGGGMVGASFALALRDTELRVLLIESVPPDSAAQPSFDERTTALGNGSRQIFEALGVWPAMAGDAAPIRSIHVSDAGRFGFARLDAREQGVRRLRLRRAQPRDRPRAVAGAARRAQRRRWPCPRNSRPRRCATDGVLLDDRASSGETENDSRGGRRGRRRRGLRAARQRGHRGRRSRTTNRWPSS